jgi:hypothetical protein
MTYVKYACGRLSIIASYLKVMNVYEFFECDTKIGGNGSVLRM